MVFRTCRAKTCVRRCHEAQAVESLIACRRLTHECLGPFAQSRFRVLAGLECKAAPSVSLLRRRQELRDRRRMFFDDVLRKFHLGERHVEGER